MLQDIKIDLHNPNDDAIDFLKSLQPKTGIYINTYSYTCYVALYLFALAYCEHKFVLDAACGYGYGSRILSTAADFVAGIDINPERINYAAVQYEIDNLKFLTMDVVNTSFCTYAFDCIVSMETFEHLSAEAAILFIEEIKRVLKPGGLLILSTPNKPIYSQITQTSDHVNELNVEELYKLLSPHFTKCTFFYQRKQVLNTMKTFYSFVKFDKINLRSFIPKTMRKFVSKYMAKDLSKDMDALLPILKVRQAHSLDDVKDAVTQIVVCEK